MGPGLSSRPPFTQTFRSGGLLLSEGDLGHEFLELRTIIQGSNPAVLLPTLVLRRHLGEVRVGQDGSTEVDRLILHESETEHDRHVAFLEVGDQLHEVQRVLDELRLGALGLLEALLGLRGDAPDEADQLVAGERLQLRREGLDTLLEDVGGGHLDAVPLERGRQLKADQTGEDLAHDVLRVGVAHGLVVDASDELPRPGRGHDREAEAALDLAQQVVRGVESDELQDLVRATLELVGHVVREVHFVVLAGRQLEVTEPVEERRIVEAVDHVALAVVSGRDHGPARGEDIATDHAVVHQLEEGLKHVVVGAVQLVQEENALMEDDDLRLVLVRGILVLVGTLVGDLLGEGIGPVRAERVLLLAFLTARLAQELAVRQVVGREVDRAPVAAVRKTPDIRGFHLRGTAIAETPAVLLTQLTHRRRLAHASVTPNERGDSRVAAEQDRLLQIRYVHVLLRLLNTGLI